MRYRLEQFQKAAKSYAANTPAQALMRHHLISMLTKAQVRHFPMVFEFGCGQGELTHALAQHIEYEEYICNDIHEYRDCALPPCTRRVCFDMREIAQTSLYQRQFHLIASNACLQWLPFHETLANLTHLLYPQGRLLIGTFGVQNCKEVRAITQVGLPYIESECMQELLSKHFICEAWHEECITLQFESALAVFRHLKQSGVNALEPCYLKKSWLNDYTQQFQNTLTYHIICFLAKRVI